MKDSELRALVRPLCDRMGMSVDSVDSIRIGQWDGKPFRIVVSAYDDMPPFTKRTASESIVWDLGPTEADR